MSRKPFITLPSDDFEFDLGDEEIIKPHEGEQVTFRQRISPADLLMVSRVAELSEDTKGLGQFLCDQAVPALARAIVDWTWTDMFAVGDEALPPPDEDVIKTLDFQEINYLLERWIEASSVGRQKN